MPNLSELYFLEFPVTEWLSKMEWILMDIIELKVLG